jgi:hypothetical protein
MQLCYYCIAYSLDTNILILQCKLSSMSTQSISFNLFQSLIERYSHPGKYPRKVLKIWSNPKFNYVGHNSAPFHTVEKDILYYALCSLITYWPLLCGQRWYIVRLGMWRRLCILSLLFSAYLRLESCKLNMEPLHWNTVIVVEVYTLSNYGTLNKSKFRSQ